MATLTSIAPGANRRRQGSLGGLLVSAMGVSLMASAITGEGRTAYLFVALGAAFTIAYAQGRQPYVYLVAASTFAALGLGMAIPAALAISEPESGSVFLGVLALGPLAVFLIRPVRRWPLAITVVLGPLAAAQALGIAFIPPAVQPLFVPATLVAVGVYLVIAPRRG